MNWLLSWRADPVVAQLADRHYSRQKIGSKQFAPPGRCVVLRTEEGEAAWITSWPYAEFVKHEWAGAWVCSFFRNEGPELSSSLIESAVAATRAIWLPPPLGIVTMVDRRKVRSKRDPGYCFLMAGWAPVGRTKDLGLYVLGQASEEMPEAREPQGIAPGHPLLRKRTVVSSER